MVVINISSAEQYSKLISSDKTSIVLFSADWAEQCKQILDVFNDLTKQKDYDLLQFLNVQAEEFSEISMKHQVEAVPTVLFFKSNLAIDRIDGCNVASLTSKCKNLANVKSDSKESLDERLKALINKSNVMIFMKGDKITPKCGFSKTLIQMINETKIVYDTFDILTDEEVRQGLKVYSDWPTYPQVYVKGELIGGLDIIKELQAGGELMKTLQE